jgi:hypothetical protein
MDTLTHALIGAFMPTCPTFRPASQTITRFILTDPLRNPGRFIMSTNVYDISDNTENSGFQYCPTTDGY